MAATETLTPEQARAQPWGSAAPSPALAPPPGNPRFPLFDGLRALAALGVLTTHVGEFSGGLGLGFAGRFEEVAVNGLLLFFAISGFLLYRPYVAANADGRPGPSLRGYARRRTLRIVPAYWVALTLLAIYPGIVGVFSGDWSRYYGFLQLYSSRTFGGGIPVAWTLCVEVTFYLALPLWAAAMRRLGGRRWVAVELSALALIAAAGLGVQLAATHGRIGYLVGLSLAGQSLWFAIGMAFAVLSVAIARGEIHLQATVRFVEDRATVCWLVAVAAYGGLMALVPNGGLLGLVAATHGRESTVTSVAKIAIEAVLVCGLVAPAVFGTGRAGLPRRLLGWRPVVLLGVISYSFYLYHLPIVELIATRGRGQGYSASGFNLLPHVHSARALVLFLASFIATAVVASISYRWVELPFLRRK